MRGSARPAWILGCVLALSWSCPQRVHAQTDNGLQTVYSLLSAVQVVGLTASNAGQAGLLSPASAALSTGLTGLYGGQSADRSSQNSFMNTLLLGAPQDTNLTSAEPQEGNNAATSGLGFRSSTGTPASGAGRGAGGSGGHHSGGAHRNTGTGSRGGGGGGGGHHGSTHHAAPAPPKAK